ncbi:MAG TPA: hypothetical protein VJL27_00250 [Patescibacteria group bacterium]|nr:hypothetical protein [Patescibacteria group bacterium]
MSNQTLPLVERLSFLTVRVGTLKTAEAMRQALRGANCRTSVLAGDMMNQPAFAAGIVQEEEDVNFVIAYNAKLGYPEVCTVTQTYEAARKRGWRTCEPPDAVYLRLATPDQPEGEGFFVATDPPITDFDGYLRVFSVVHDSDGCWLGGDYGRPGHLWGGHYRWAFRCK